MCSYVLVLTNLECPSATETHHLTHQKCHKYKGLQRKHFDSCGLFYEEGISQRNLPPVLKKPLLQPVCLWDDWSDLLLGTTSEKNSEYFSSGIFCISPLLWQPSRFWKHPAPWWEQLEIFLKLHWKMRKTKKKLWFSWTASHLRIKHWCEMEKVSGPSSDNIDWLLNKTSSVGDHELAPS